VKYTDNVSPNILFEGENPAYDISVISPMQSLNSLFINHYNLLIKLNYLYCERLPTGILQLKKLIFGTSAMVLLFKTHTNTLLYNFVSLPKTRSHDPSYTAASVELQGANLENYVLKWEFVKQILNSTTIWLHVVKEREKCRFSSLSARRGKSKKLS
jgi:hypothetical protein